MKDHVRGNVNARTVLVEYGDFECPYCAMAYPIVKEIAERHRDDLAEVFRPFPLVEMHPHAMHAAQAAQAAGVQDKFWQMHDLLFENRTKLDDESLLAYASQLDLDLGRFSKDFESPATIQAIQQSYKRGIQEGVKGTPAFFLNGEQLQIAGYGDLERAVEQAVAQGHKRGVHHAV